MDEPKQIPDYAPSSDNGDHVWQINVFALIAGIGADVLLFISSLIYFNIIVDLPEDGRPRTLGTPLSYTALVLGLSGAIAAPIAWRRNPRGTIELLSLVTVLFYWIGFFFIFI